MEAVDDQDEAKKQAKLSMMYRNFARRAGVELVNATGAKIKTGGRARTPSLRQCSFANKTIRSLAGQAALTARQ